MQGEDAARETRLKVGGMDCGSCAGKIETGLGRLPGVGEVVVSLSTGTVVVKHGVRTALADMERVVSMLGFTPLGAERPASQEGGGHSAHDCRHEHSETRDHDHGGAGPWWRSRQGLLTLGCGAALALAYGVGVVLPAAERWAFLAAMMVGLVPIARQAVVTARLGTPFSIEMLMTVAALGAVLIGAEEEAAAVVFLFLIGESLEGLAASRARSGIRALMNLMPKIARREDSAGRLQEVAAEDLAVGDVISIRPGDRIPADGTILSGTAGVDESPVTGESVPKVKSAGDAVWAGTINIDGALRVSVTADASGNTIARIVRMVEQAQERKAPTARFIERFARIYTPAVVALAALVAVLPPLLAGGAWNEWVYKGLAVLLIGCPCALVISTPAAIASGLSAGARRGLLMKGGEVLERLGHVTLVAFDKTGTLTEGKPAVTDIQAFGHDEREVLALAAGLSAASNHPLARAIIGRATAEGIVPETASEVAEAAGQGLTGMIKGRRVFLGAYRATTDGHYHEAIAALAGQGKTISVLMIDGQVVGLVALRDTLRPDAVQAVVALKQAGIGALMVTGDQQAAAEAVGRELGIQVHAGLLPEDKLAVVRARQAKGECVAKVGDGINDAPALAAADVGIAMGSGTDVALETADAASLHGRVTDVAAMVALSRRTLANIRQNVVIALGLKAVFLVTTLMGLTGLWPAVLADTGATVLVTINALRLLGRGGSSQT